LLDCQGTGTQFIRARTNDTSGAAVGSLRAEYLGGGGGVNTNVELRAGDAYTYLVNTTNHPLLFGTNALERARIDSSGRLLVGTSTSVNVGTIVGTTQQIAGSGQPLSLRRFSNSTVGPNILFGKTRATTDATYTIVENGDTLGGLIFAGSDGVDLETPGASIVAEVDGTPGANDMPGRLVFSTTADGASSPTERMRIDSSGNILWVSSSNKAGIDAGTVDGKYVSSTGAVLVSSRSSTSTVNHNTFINGNGAVGSISTNASATAYNTSSDYRLKENVTAVTDGITRLQQLKPSRFNFIANPDKTVDGFIAHEVQAIVPEAIAGEKDAVDDDGNPKYQGIDQSKLVPLLTAALQEAIGEIESLKARVVALEAS
jgi:hypothetical protein